MKRLWKSGDLSKPFAMPKEREFREKAMLRHPAREPAELFPAILLGGVLLVWVALRAHSHGKLIGGSLVLAVVLLLGAQALAEVTGLGSGATEPVGWPWMLVLGSLVLFLLAILGVGVGGVLLLRDLFKVNKISIVVH
jgi:hypothetical protein